VRLYHVTPERNWESIRQNGLLVSKAREGRDYLTCVPRSVLAWALDVVRPCYPKERLVIVYLDVPKSWVDDEFPPTVHLRRNVPPERILGLLFVEDCYG
jgi:hypothetical protein